MPAVSNWPILREPQPDLGFVSPKKAKGHAEVRSLEVCEGAIIFCHQSGRLREPQPDLKMYSRKQIELYYLKPKLR